MHHREQWNCHVNWGEHAELDDLIRDRRQSGVSFSLIALEIGRMGIHVTRNAIIGRAQRKGFKGMTQPIARKPHSQGFRERNGKFASLPKRERKPPLKLVPKPSDVVFLDLPIVELDRHQCRFPNPNWHGYPMLFCGNPVQPGSWCCPTHHRMSYVRPK